MNNTPGRALIACTFCRQRKRKCNGQKPQCRACRLKGLPCIYANPDSQRMEEATGSQNPAQRMEVAESLLHQHTESIEAINRHIRLLSESLCSGIAGHRNAPVSLCLSPSLENISRACRNNTQVNSTSGQSTNTFPPITIPIGHQTSTSDLLMLPQVGRLAGWYPDGFFRKIEERRQRSHLVHTMPHSTNKFSQLDSYVDRAAWGDYLKNFFDLVHPFHPFLDKDELLSRYEDTMAGLFHHDAQSALILAVLGLGAMASDPIDLNSSDKPYSGDVYIQQALGVLLPLWSISFQGDVLMIQALLLCAIYFTYTIDPMMAWRLVHMASTNIQQKFLSCRLEAPSHDPQVQSLIRLGWVCFVIECDVLAEFHLPRSGIELLADKMPLPDYNGPPSPQKLYVLADITARSLLNRIHHALFAVDNHTMICAADPLVASTKHCLPTLGPDAPLFRVCKELDRQLEAWYESLPAAIKPDLYGQCEGGNQTCLLRLRYFSAKQNIYRPVVIYVISSGTGDICDFPPSILNKCGICLEACHSFLLTAGHILSYRTPFTYSVAQCCLGSALILAIAAQNPVLKKSSPREVNPILKLAIDNIRPWAQADSSLKDVHEIASSIAAKLRFES